MNALTPAVPRPAHVPPEAVYDFDLRFDPALLENPHERVRELLRTAPPVFWTPRNGGRWIATGHAEIFEASRATDRFSSMYMTRQQLDAMLATMPRDMPRIPQSTPIALDPPEHTKYRAPLQKVFSPRAAVSRLEEVRELIDNLLDRVIDQGHCEFITAVAEPVPVTVFLRMMGLPVERLGEFRELVHEFMSETMNGAEAAGRAARKVADAMLTDILSRQHDPRDDIISLLWATEIEGEPMTLELMEDYAVLLFVAGLDTVINGMGFGIRHLAMHPELQAELRADPERIPDAVEELLRRYTFTMPTRRVACDTQLGGFDLKADEWLILFLAGADLDPREFDAPESFDLDRENKVHIAFGAGVHRCLGAHLARVELQVLYRQVLGRLPPFRLDPDAPARFHLGNIIAFDALPIRWD